MHTKSPPDRARYVIEGVRYEVDRVFTGAIPLRKIMEEEIISAERKSSEFDRAANL